MSYVDNLCMGCMKQTAGQAQCPHCGFDQDFTQRMPYLPVKTTINERYLVGKLLESGGDGATYIGWDLTQHCPIYIREFLPDTLAVRLEDLQLSIISGCEHTFQDCYQTFLEMWRNIARMRELSAIVPVYDIVEDYGTAYVISEYMETTTLREYLLNSPNGYLTWDKARQLFMPLLSTLGALHSAGIVHRGISPSSLRICKDNRMRIFDFGIWQCRTAGGDLTAVLAPGYAALEQYNYEDQQGPWIDIYALTACLYRTLVGNAPMEATERLLNDRLMVPAKINEQLPAYVTDALANGLQIKPQDRTKTIEQFRSQLSASPEITVTQTIVNQAEKRQTGEVRLPKEPQKKQTSTRKTVLITVIVMLLIFIGTALVLSATVFSEQVSEWLGIGQMTDPTNSETERTTSSEMVSVPDFVALNKTDQEIMDNVLYNRDFYIEYKYEPSETVSSGYVFSQSVEAGTRINRGSDLTLYISTGMPQVVLPDVVGLNESLAISQLETRGFDVTVVYIANDGNHSAGEVYQMSKTFGVSYDKGTEVIITVWRAVEIEGS